MSTDHPLTPGCTHAGGVMPDVRAVVTWSFATPVDALSSAAVGGGRQRLDWALNIGVPDHYRRHDLDAHAGETASHLGLRGAGTTLFTAADVQRMVTCLDEDIRVDATVGVTKPTWAADTDARFARRTPDGWVVDEHRWEPGTINIVVQLPVPLGEGAAVNAVITATEAKSQALFEAGIPGTGTASDAVVVCWPTTGTPQAFAGPRAPWGARIGRAVHAAMVDGLAVHP